MYNNKKIIALIPARGGSKGIPLKNIIQLCGKPLIEYSIDAATSVSYIDSTVVSTDSDEIIDLISKKERIKIIKRPSQYATDSAKSIDVIIHTIDYMKKQGFEYDIIILLQPTSPLRSFKDIERSIEMFVDNEFDSLVSINEVADNPVLIRSCDGKNQLSAILNQKSDVRRQDFEKYYVVNGAIYINHIKDINNDLVLNDNKYGYIMENDNCIDIDEYADLEKAKIILNKGNKTGEFK